MWWQYLLVFVGSLLVDLFPIPLPPAFTIMMVMQINFGLNIWVTIGIGVLGSVIGRAAMTLYIPKISNRMVNADKAEDVRFLGEKMQQNRWTGQGLIFVYSLLPLPTTPLFIAGGMANMKLYQMIPAFFFGKLISDTIAVVGGMYAAKNTAGILEGMVSWKSLFGLIVGVLLLIALFFVDWRTLLQKKQFKFKFNILQK